MTFLDVFWLLVFVPLVFMVVFVSKRLFGHWLSPLSIFLGINSLSMCGYHLRLLEMPETSLEVHGLLLAAFVMFTLGTLLAVGRRPRVGELVRRDNIDVTGLDGFFYFTVVLATLGWVIQGGMLVSKLGLGILLSNIWLLQGEFQIQFVGYLNMIGILVFPVFVLRRALGNVNRLDYVLVLSSLFGLLLAGIKGYMIYSLFGGAYVLSVVRPEKFKLKHLAAGMGIVVVFFVVYAAKIDVWSTEHYVGSGLMKWFPALKMPYLYFVGSWPAFNYVVDGTVEDLPRLGTLVFQPIWKFLGAMGFLDYTPPSQPFVSFGKFTFNVYSMVGELYWDLKWPGVLSVSFLLGLINTRLYLRAVNSDYWGHMIIYAVFVHGLFISFFSFIYTFNIYVLLLYVFLLGFVWPRGGVLVRMKNSVSNRRGDG